MQDGFPESVELNGGLEKAEEVGWDAVAPNADDRMA